MPRTPRIENLVDWDVAKSFSSFPYLGRGDVQIFGKQESVVVLVLKAGE